MLPTDEALIRAGDWILMFGAAAQVVRVEDPPGFPGARQLVLQPVAGPETPTLVPHDFEPVRISWAETASNRGGQRARL